MKNNRKKLLWISAIVLSAVLLFSCVIQAEQPQLSLSTSCDYHTQEATVSIHIGNHPGFAYLKLKVAYGDGLTLVRAENTGILDGSFVTSQTSSQNPYVLQWTNAQDLTGEGCIATLHFRFSEDSWEKDCSVNISVDSCFNQNLDRVDISVQEEQAIISACTHAEKTGIDAKAATCGESGWNAYEICDACGALFSTAGDKMEKPEEIPAIGHTYVNGVCTRCGSPDPEHMPCDGGEGCPARHFLDQTKPENWAHKGIDFCIAQGYMKGISENLFSPEGVLTRAQFVTILYRMGGEMPVTYQGIFCDVPANSWYSDAIEWAAENNIVNGVQIGIFEPDSPITREQIVTILHRFQNCPEIEADMGIYPDWFDVSAYARSAMQWANACGILQGIRSGDTVFLQPKAGATRAQIATIVMRYLQKQE